MTATTSPRKKRNPGSGIQTEPPPLDTTSRDVIIKTIEEITASLDSALVIAEAEGLLKASGRKRTPLTDVSKTNALNQLRTHPEAVKVEKALAVLPDPLKRLFSPTKELQHFYPQAWWTPFFISLATYGSMRKAAAEAEVSYHMALLAKASSPVFLMIFGLAMEISTQTLEDEAKRRALGGSDLLMIFMLKGAAPEKYKERVEVVSPGSVRRKAERLAAKLGVDPEELARLAEEIAAEDDGES